MEVTVHYDDGTESDQFNADDVETVNDVAYVDGILHTNVEGVDVSC